MILFVILISVSDVLRHYWVLLILSALATGAPFILGASGSRTKPLPLYVPDPGPGHRSDAATLIASAISIGKASAVDGENEDALSIDIEGGYLAIADGASTSFAAAEWAQKLCDTFLQKRPLHASPSNAWITEATTAFHPTAHESADWWSIEAAQRGAHAAFLGLSVIREQHRLGWRGLAVGDCVLIHLRACADGQLPIVTAFPIAHSASFPPNPVLLSSTANGHPPISYIDGPASIGDIWLLMTDELARWALRQHEAGDPVWTWLARGSEAEIRARIDSARASELVVDDDMTIIRCEAVLAD